MTNTSPFRLLVFMTLALSAMAVASRAGAHTDLIASSPQSGATVGGDVTTVVMAFSLGVTSIDAISVTDPSGSDLPLVAAISGNTVIDVELDAPLTMAGLHVLRFEVTSIDGDANESGFAFNFDPVAPPPERLALPDFAPPAGFDESTGNDPPAAPLPVASTDKQRSGSTSTIIAISVLSAGLLGSLVVRYRAVQSRSNRL